ncbi:MAG: hypothetical protein OQL19_11375 [Gammaproteobacteria bacterium]|nr:hypothetical protein [Gammaproteobacteria bacterium]
MKTIFSLMIIALTSQNLMAHEEVIQGVMKHSHYLNELQVKTFGDLRLIRENKLTESFPFSKIKSDDLYGIGMPQGLDKELLISSGDLYESFFDNYNYSTGIVKEDRDIAFLAYVNVKKWTTVRLPENIITFTQLENALPELAKSNGLNSTAPFPFILHAKIDGLRWFIVDGMGNGKPNYLSSFLRSRYIGGLDNIEIEGIGFYSDKHKGIMSAPNSNIHIHFRTISKPLFVGHIDDEMFLAKGAILQFPSID